MWAFDIKQLCSSMVKSAKGLMCYSTLTHMSKKKKETFCLDACARNASPSFMFREKKMPYLIWQFFSLLLVVVLKIHYFFMHFSAKHIVLRSTVFEYYAFLYYFWIIRYIKSVGVCNTVKRNLFSNSCLCLVLTLSAQMHR